MKERDIKDITNDIEKLYDKVRNYIKNTEHYIYNWIDNRHVLEYIEEYPNDFEERISFRVEYVSSCFAYLEITFDDCHPNDVDGFKTFCNLWTLRENAAALYRIHKDDLIKIHIEETEKSVEYHKKELEKAEAKLKELNDKIGN